MNHPAQFSPEVLDVVASLIHCGDHVHDPFAGTGLRLGQLCDEIGARFTGIDIEPWPGRDPRVDVGDALDPTTYPDGECLIITSPTYANKRLADYPNGPTPTTKTKGRRDYAIALGQPLHPDNLARTTGRPARAADYWRLHAQAVKLWPARCIVNVDEPISDRWREILRDQGYSISCVLPAYTRRYGGLHNAEKRAEHEVVIVAELS